MSNFRHYKLPYTIDSRYEKKAAYFSMEFAIHQPLKIYSGGLGFLSGSHLRSAYVYNTEGLFTLILTESNEPVEEKTVYNPIDTLSRKDPLSGDYKQDKKNFVSVRDGGKPGKLLFFINIEKTGNGCDGSLRGDMVQVKPRVYQYNKADDHCILEFNFNGKTVQVRELEACGNHRGIRCSFDGRFKK